MTIESPAEMVTEHDTLRPEAETSAQTPKAKRSKKSGKGSKSRGSAGASGGKKSGKKKATRSTPKTAKNSKARPPKKSKRASKKASPRSSKVKGVKTTTRSGKKITRTKAGGKGVLASKGLHLLVVRVPAKVHEKVWRKAKAKGIPLNRWLNTLIARGVK